MTRNGNFEVGNVTSVTNLLNYGLVLAPTGVKITVLLATWCEDLANTKTLSELQYQNYVLRLGLFAAGFCNMENT
jgi:hypothetical protein